MSSDPGAKPEAIPLSVPEIRGNEWRYVRECLDTGWVSSAGSFVNRFEQHLADATQTQHAVATVNGTAALHIALQVVGVEPEDEVLVSDLTFIASANAIRYAGAWPVLIDAEPDYWQISPTRLADFLDRECDASDRGLINRHTGRRVRAILPVHVLGHPVDMDPVCALARRYDLPVVEDAAESLGATYRGRPVGQLGDIACFSFNGNKLVTTGGGGMVVTNNAQWAERARYLTTQAKDDVEEFVHGEVGYNYRLTNVLAAIGCAQLELLAEYVDTKRRIAETYRAAFEGLAGITLMPEAPWAQSTRWLYTILVDAEVYGEDSRALMGRLTEARIQSRPLWQPMHLSPAQQDAVDTGCPVAERLNRDALSLPSSVGLTAPQQQRVIHTICRTH